MRDFAAHLTTLGLALALAPAAWGQPAGSSGEFQVNTDDSFKQKSPVGSFDAEGRYAVAWENDIRGITARFYDAQGGPFGGERLLVASDPTPVPYNGPAIANRDPAITYDPAGGYLLVWTEEDAFVRVTHFLEQRDVRDTTILGQRFDTAGNPETEPFKVNASAAGLDQRAQVVHHRRNRAAVVWEKDGEGIYLQVLNRQNEGLDEDVRVDEGFGVPGERPSVAANPKGDLLVVFHACCDANGDKGVYARLFDRKGDPEGGAFALNTAVIGDQQAASVASIGDGSFLAVWQSPLDATAEEYHVFGQVVDGGALLGTELEISSGLGWGHSAPAAAVNSMGDITVAWLVWNGDFRVAVWGRQLDSLGNPEGESFAISELPIGGQTRFGLTAGSTGAFLATWLGFHGDELGVSGRFLGSKALDGLCSSAPGVRNLLADHVCEP